jgi:3-oxoacyl-ACP reductase-like protein
MTTDDELKAARRDAREQRARADRFGKVAEAERDKRKAMAKKIKALEAVAFRRGSAITVASYMSALGDDGLMMAFQDHVRRVVQRRPINAKKAAKIVDALCARFSVELRGSDELIELVYRPQLSDSKNAQA